MSRAGAGVWRERLRRFFSLTALLAAAWSAGLSLTGGGLLIVGGIRISSRNPMTPLIVACLAALVAYGLGPARQRLPVLLADWDRLTGRLRVRAVRARTGGVLERLERRPGSPSRAAAGAGLLAAGVVAVGIWHGTWAVGGSDVYGYVSYARLFATGRLAPERPLLDELHDPALAAAIPPEALAPLGYVVREDRTLAPIYSPGLPLVMAAFERVGGAAAVFLVVPLFAGIGVWATYLLGRTLGGPSTGLVAAALLASSPAMLGQLTIGPMSDVVAMAWWAVCLALLSLQTRRAAGLAGAAAGAAILTRPNLVPLALVPAAWLAWRALEAPARGRALARLLLFGVAALPGCLLVAWLNDYWFGSPLASGYGSLSQYFERDHLPVNLVRYPRWLLETQTPVVLLALAAPWLVRRTADGGDGRGAVVCCGAFVLASFASYAWYTPYEGWWWLRFVLPAFPPLLALTAAVLVTGARRQPDGRRLLPVVVLGLVLYGLAFSRQQLVFEPGGEWKYPAVGAYIAEHLPDRAVFVALHHSGSVRYYAGRATVRYDRLPPSGLDAAIMALRSRGYEPFILLDEMEEASFRAHLGAGSRWGALDWEPLVEIEPDRVRIYDPFWRD